MSYKRPLLPDLIPRIQTDLETYLENNASRQRGTLEHAISYANAGMAHSLHGHLSELAKNLHPSTCDEDTLLLYAEQFGIVRNQPTAATFNVLFTGLATTNIPLGTQIQSPSGVVYETTVDVDIPALAPLEIEVSVIATDDFLGTQGNSYGGAILGLSSPIFGIEPNVIVVEVPNVGAGGAGNLETISGLRTRVLARYQQAPSGGGPGDYVAWAKDNAAVTRAWEDPGLYGPPTVAVFIVQDTFLASGFLDETIFLGAGTLAAVQAYIEARAPVTAIVSVETPIEVTLNPSIQIEPNTSLVQEQIQHELEDLILRKAQPGGTVLISEINEAISLAQGETDHILISPVANVTVAYNELLTLGTITFSDIP